MQPTYLSILSSDAKVVSLISKINETTSLFIGYRGSNNEDLESFIKEKQNARHLLFLKPSKTGIKVGNPVHLKKMGDVDVVILGKELPKDLIGFVQENKIAGFINLAELDAAMLIDIQNNIEINGYHANKHIPAEYWENQTPHLFPRPKPDLTPGEEEVLLLLCHNFTVKEICQRVGKNEPAIRAHISNLRNKLVAKTLLEIVVISMANMWVNIDTNLTSSESPFFKDSFKNQ